MMSTHLPAPQLSAWRWWVCSLLMLATVVNYMDRMALNQLALQIQTSLGIDDEQYSWLESIFSFAFAIGAVTTGFIVDRISVRWIYPFMVFGWSVVGILTGFADGFWMLLACRFALGLFESGNWPCGMRTTRAVLRPAERSFGNSLFQSGTALGAVITPLVVLYLLRWIDPEDPFRKASMAVVGGSFAVVTNAPTNTWQIPFRVIGSLGLVWVVLWFVTIPRRMLQEDDRPSTNARDVGAVRFTDIFRDKRFWALFAVVVAINVTWHGYRSWLPLYLQKQRGYTTAEMSRFTTLYYLVADIGSWTVGIATLVMCRSGLSVHRARTLALAGCSGLTLCATAVPFLPDGVQLQAGLLAVAFGALGLFPTYFSLSQEISAKHQGKLTGILGACTHFSLSAIYPIEGRIVRVTQSYEWVLGGIGVAPLIALIVMLWLWPPRSEPDPSA